MTCPMAVQKCSSAVRDSSFILSQEQGSPCQQMKEGRWVLAGTEAKKGDVSASVTWGEKVMV